MRRRVADAGAGATAPPTATATTLPARLDSLKWTIAVGFAAIFALGLIFLLRRPESGHRHCHGLGARAGAEAEAQPFKGGRRYRQRESKVSGSLDEMKENLFKLELRRQAGTIAEEDYARETCAHAEGLLRDLVKG